MSYRAWSYIAGVIALGLGLSVFMLLNDTWALSQWLPFVILVTSATLSQLYKAEAPNHIAFFATPVFLFAGLILLSPSYFVILVTIPHLAEWLFIYFSRKPGTHLRSWYIQPFNIAMHIIAGNAALQIYTVLDQHSTLSFTLPVSIVHLAAALGYLLINQVILGQALVLARDISWRESGVLDIKNLAPEFIMLCLGVMVATLWKIDRWFIVPALAPLVLMYRSLMVPLLEQEAQIDSKTGLYNARHFNRRFTEELDRARRFKRPLALIMADLDFLRNINNTYGHLAGDVVLSGIAGLIRQTVREYDVASRFGGEEFAIVVPEAGELEAYELAERIRQLIESTSWTIASHPTPIHATMSLGVACYPDHAQSQEDLIHEADVALYQAKFNGRNRVFCASDVPQSVKLAQAAEFVPAVSPQAPQIAIVADTTIVPPAMPVIPDTQSSAVAKPTKQISAPQQPQTKKAAPSTSANVKRAAETKQSDAPVANTWARRGLWAFVSAVIAAGCGAAVLGSTFESHWPWALLGLLMVLAASAELLQISVYGENSISVSLVIIIAGALICGMPGVIVASTGIVIADQFRQRRSLAEFYKVAFNWATHVIAGTAPALVHIMVGSLLAGNLLQLGILTLLAGLCYYSVETGLISVAISLTRMTSPLNVWQTQFRWLMGHYLVSSVLALGMGIAYTALGLVGIAVFTLPVLMLRYAQQQYIARTEASVRELKRMNRELARANQEIGTASQAIRDLNDELFLTLGTVLDARDPYVSGHAAQVATYAAAIAKELGLPPEQVEWVRQAGFLHDIGKIAIPEHILYKPEKLTAAEYEMMKKHAALGSELLETSTRLRYLAPLVRHHHERWDGAGYPAGLKGEEIPLEARILNICDSVEAMAADRPYHRGMLLPDILAEVRRCAGTQFDPALVEVFLQVAEREGEVFITNSAREVLRKQISRHAEHQYRQSSQTLISSILLHGMHVESVTS